jgi:lambda repressor-like predicted transcriptional regulator
VLKETDLKILVLKRGFRSYSALAKKAGIHPQTLNALFRNKRKTEKHRRKVAELLKVPPDFLWD